MENTIKFADAKLVNGQLVETNIRMMKQSTIGNCPHFIFVPEHYRKDGTCKCNDKSNTIMKEWGYKWKNGAWR